LPSTGIQNETGPGFDEDQPTSLKPRYLFKRLKKTIQFNPLTAGDDIASKKKTLKSVASSKPSNICIHLKVLDESFHMNTYDAGFR